ncbi:MAG: ribosome silencing factor [Solirubrobacteraceae bacterium]
MTNAPQSEPYWKQEDSRMTPETILSALVERASDRKAEEIVSLDLRAIGGFADYFLICTGRSDRQCRAIHDAIHLGMKSEHGLLPARVEGMSEGRWILMDYLDVVVHVFTPETRERYRLEQLWREAPITRLEPVTADA